MSKFLVKQTLLYSFGELVPKLIAFLLLPIYTNFLTLEEYGILSYTSAVMMFVYVLSTFSLNSYVLRRYSEIDSTKEKKLLLGNFFILIAIINCFLSLLGYIFLPYIITTFKLQIPWEPYFKLAVLINFFEVFSIIPLIIYRVKQRAGAFVVLSLSRTLLQLGLTYYLIVIAKKGLYGNYLGQLLPLCCYFFIYWSIIVREGIFNINIKQMKEGLKFSWPLLPGSLAFLALGLIDRIILERFVPIAQLGLYNVAYLISLSVNIIISSGYKAIEPQIFLKFRESNFVEYIKNVQSVFLFIVYFTAALVALFSQEVFKFMTSEEFYTGYYLVPIIMVGVIMTGQNVIYSGVLIAEKNTKAVGFSTIVGALVNVIFNLIFIPIFGTFAAALSVAITFSVINGILFHKMELVGKEYINELKILFLFIIMNFILFFILDVEISIQSFAIKLALFLVFTYFLGRIYKLNLFKMFKELRRTLGVYR